jgi:hypothetical protein
MDVLLIATGFTGALTLVWLARLAVKVLFAQGGTAHFGESCTDAILAEVKGARREVLLAAGTLASRPVAQALVDARLRGAQVEVILGSAGEADADSELHFLAGQGLTPLVEDDPASRDYLLIDGRTAVVLPSPGFALIVRGLADVAHAIAGDFAARRGKARALPVSTERPSTDGPDRATDDLLEAVARSVTAPTTSGESASGPVVTAATAELFARLRQEAAEAPAEEEEEGEADPAGKAA